MVDRSNFNILIIDDDPEIVDIIKITLELDGYRVICLYKGDEAITFLKTQPHPDLILLDLFLAGSDGKAICKQIKSNPSTSSIPIILVSANINLSKTANDVGADDYIQKPFDLSLINSKIEALLNRV